MHSKIWPLFFLLAGCATSTNSIVPVVRDTSQSISVRIIKMDQLQNTYELAPRVGWVNSSSTEAVKQALAEAAAAVCAPGAVAMLDVERPDYIHLPMAPRGYLRCR